MKFAKQLMLRAIPSWSDHYMDYKSLKKVVKDYGTRYQESKDDAVMKEITIAEFCEAVKVEAQKVDDWHTAKEKEAEEKLEALDGAWNVTMNDEEQENWISEMDELILHLENLLDFCAANNAAFKKILKKFDKHLSTDLSRTFWTTVTNYRFVKSQKDEQLLLRAKQAWRKRVPAVTVDSPEPLQVLDTSVTPTVSCLDLDALPRGQVSHLWVAITEDGLGNVTKVPVIVARGLKGGPIVGLTAALHGNELNGIPLIHRLFREIDCQELHGTLVACPVANAAGYLRGQRGYSDGSDLNRMMPGKQNGSAPQVYAFNLMERLIKKMEYLLDLHTASKGRVNSLYVRADMIDSRTRKMATLQNPQIIVHNSAPDGSLRGAAMAAGIPAITVEIGDPSRFQKRFIKNALLGVTNILCHLNMTPQEPDMSDFQPVVCSRSYWIFAEQGGVLNVLPEICTWVRKGEPIAYLHSLFGGILQTYVAPEDGIVIGKSVDPVCESGSRILHLGVVHEEFPRVANDGHL